MTIKIFAHNAASEGARNLSQALGFRRLRHEGSRWVPRAGDTVINWGSSGDLSRFRPANVINHPDNVRQASNKLAFFQRMFVDDESPRTPDWTTDIAVARGWCTPETWVVCRTLLTSHSGRGIIIAKSPEEVVDAPLYTRYVKKQAEYRVHIVQGRVIDVQRKIRDPDRTPTDWSVRSHANGFIFVRNDVELPADAQTQALRAYNASGLDFGAVDVIVNRDGRAYVLEINTAPGLTGTTVDNYAAAFRTAFGIAA